MLHRRTVLALLASATAGPAFAQGTGMSRISAHSFTFAALDGGTIDLSGHAGKPILVVNTASQCGFTPQLAGLEELWQRYRARGLLVVGVPSNEFDQEPGGSAAIGETAHGRYGVTFPIAQKAALRGAGAHPFYRWAAAERPEQTPRWNFHKYLVGHDGRLAAAFDTRVVPTDPRVIEAIMRELPAN
jgi:glutathione peroxidase